MSFEIHKIEHDRSQQVINFAYNYAKAAHEGQFRKYTNEPYIVHPLAVAQLVYTVSDSFEAISAAFLHDVLEDTEITAQEMSDAGFRHTITNIVLELTDVPKEFGNRAERKAEDRRRLASASKEAKTVKLADLIDNSSSIIKHDPNFAKVYMREKEQLLESLEGGDPTLFKRAGDIIMDYYLGRNL